MAAGNRSGDSEDGGGGGGGGDSEDGGGGRGGRGLSAARDDDDVDDDGGRGRRRDRIPTGAPPSSAAVTALACPTDRDLRVPCYCEENVWRLAYRRLRGASGGGLRMHRDAEYYVVFISNGERVCPMFCQLAKERSDEPCFWDYHVILMRSGIGNRTPKVLVDEDAENGKKLKSASGGNSSAIDDVGANSNVVLDMDSRLPWGCSVEEYLEGSFRNLAFIHEQFRAKYAPLFRVVKADLFLRHFYSDRMHMYDPASGQWHAPPPSYECIMAGWDDGCNHDGASSGGRRSNLSDYINMVDSVERKRSSSLDVVEKEEWDGILGEVLTFQEFREKFRNKKPAEH